MLIKLSNFYLIIFNLYLSFPKFVLQFIKISSLLYDLKLENKLAQMSFGPKFFVAL